MSGRPFTARFAGLCERCEKPITAGVSLVVHDTEWDGWVHDGCHEPPDETARVCPICFMTTCDCGKDL